MDANRPVHRLFAKAHHLIEASESRRISQSEMAARLGISVRAYSKYLHGQETTALSTLDKLLGQLTDEQIISLLHQVKNREN